MSKVAFALAILLFTATGHAGPLFHTVVSGICPCDQSPCSVIPLTAGQQFDLTDVTIAVPPTNEAASQRVTVANSGLSKVVYIVAPNSTLTQSYSSPIRFDGGIGDVAVYCAPALKDASVTVSGVKGEPSAANCSAAGSC